MQFVCTVETQFIMNAFFLHWSMFLELLKQKAGTGWDRILPVVALLILVGNY